MSSTGTPSTRPPQDPLERQLRELTMWDGPSPHPPLWHHALRSEQTPASRLRRTFTRPLRFPTAAIAAVLALGAVAVLVGSMLPHLGRARSVRPAEMSMSNAAPSAAQVSDFSESSFRRRAVDPAPTGLDTMPRPDGLPAFTPESARGATRAVTRHATIELKTPDVRGAAAKAALLVNEALGEFVQESAITGAGDSLHGTITLRVAAGRLSAVLEALRELGEVTGESLRGDDVTAQVVDLEARLRNEQRVERELLELMDRRQEAPLREILELREHLARVRVEIERLTAQRDRLSQMVSLATVLVIIRGDSEAPKTGGQLGDYFTSAVGLAWHSGARALVDSLALVVKVVIGGAVFWILLAIVGIALWRTLRRPAPTSPSASPAAG